MEFSARDDIEAPIEFVFDQITDFKSFERSIMRRGGDVKCLSGDDVVAVDSKWRVNFRMRGKDRSVVAQVVRADRPGGVTVDVTSRSVDGEMMVELMSLSKTRTRLTVTAVTNAKTIPAKLLFQSIRFARAKTQKRFKVMVSSFAVDVETRYSAKSRHSA